MGQWCSIFNILALMFSLGQCSTFLLPLGGVMCWCRKASWIFVQEKKGRSAEAKCNSSTEACYSFGESGVISCLNMTISSDFALPGDLGEEQVLALAEQGGSELGRRWECLQQDSAAKANQWVSCPKTSKAQTNLQSSIVTPIHFHNKNTSNLFYIYSE